MISTEIGFGGVSFSLFMSVKVKHFCSTFCVTGQTSKPCFPAWLLLHLPLDVSHFVWEREKRILNGEVIHYRNAGTGADTWALSLAPGYAVAGMSHKLSASALLKLCNKTAVSMPPVVCLFCLFSCCFLSWFFLIPVDLLCPSWHCVSLLSITLQLSSSACWYIHSITSWWLLKLIANRFQKIQLDTNFFLLLFCFTKQHGNFSTAKFVACFQLQLQAWVWRRGMKKERNQRK